MIYIDAKILLIISLIYLNEYSELKEIQSRHQWREKKQLITAIATNATNILASSGLVNASLCLNALGQIIIIADPRNCTAPGNLLPTTPPSNVPPGSTPPGNNLPPGSTPPSGTPTDNSGIAPIVTALMDLILGFTFKDNDCSISSIEGKCMLPTEAQIFCNGPTYIYCNSTQCPGNLKCCLNTQKKSSELTSEVTTAVIKVLSQLGFLNPGGSGRPSLPGSNQYPYSPPYSSYPSYPRPMYPTYSKPSSSMYSQGSSAYVPLPPPNPQYGGK